MIKKIEEGILPSEEEWSNYIDNLKKKTKESSLKELESVFTEAIKKRGKNNIAVLFSGGVDSTFIAFLLKKFHFDPLCICVGLKDSPDILVAKKAAEELNLNLIFKEFSDDEALKLFKETAKLYKNPSTLDVGVGSVVFAGIELGAKKGITTFFTGLGSEEIFAGYQRHELSDNIQEECWKGLKTMYKRDFLRDFPIAKFFNVNFALPFLDEKVILSAMGISAEEKLNKELKKLPIRNVASKLGLPDEFAFRKKKAAQYGSSFDKLLRRFARNKSIKKEEFVSSLILD